MSMNSASKVGEIFIAAGAAFSELAELSMQLHLDAEINFGSPPRAVSIIRSPDSGIYIPRHSNFSGSSSNVSSGLSSPISVHTGMFSSPSKSSADFTLNMLNSEPDDLDVDNIYSEDEVGLDFVSSPEEQ